jgi:hypothetical protein
MASLILNFATKYTWSASRSGRFTPGEWSSNTHWIGELVRPRPSLDILEQRKISCPCRGSNADSSVIRPPSVVTVPLLRRRTVCHLPVKMWASATLYVTCMLLMHDWIRYACIFQLFCWHCTVRHVTFHCWRSFQSDLRVGYINLEKCFFSLADKQWCSVHFVAGHLYGL